MRETLKSNYRVKNNNLPCLCSVCGLILPEPTYQGPENVIYLRGATGLQEELQRDTRVVWLVAFYTVWNPACVTFAPIFSELSTE